MSGPHAGAEISLHDGDWTVGRDTACDVVLNDVLLAANHFKFSIAGEKLELEKQDGKVYVNGQLLEGDRVEFEPYQLITAGSTHFMVGEPDRTWPEVSMVEMPGKQSSPNRMGETPREEPVRRRENFFAGKQIPMTPAKRRQHFILAGFGLVVLIVSVCIGYIVLPSPSSQIPPLEQELRETLSSYPWAKGLELENDEGQWVVRGYVQTLAQRRDLIKATNRLGGAVLVRVWSHEGMIEDAKNLLRALRLNMEVTVPEDGVVRVRGFVADMGDWEKASTHLREDVPGLKQLEDSQIIRQDQAVATANRVLAELGLAESVQLLPERGSFVARGQVTEDTFAAWQELPKKLEESLGFPVNITTLVRLPDKAAVVESSSSGSTGEGGGRITSIAVGEMSWATLSSGQKFFTGAVLPSGASIESINADGVIVKKDGTLQTVKIGEELWTKP